LTAFFNSKIFRFCFKEYFPELLGETRELRKVFFETIPVKDSFNEDWFVQKISEIQEKKIQSISTVDVELSIESALADHYLLSDKERRLIEENC
jgi:hypothetical protein